jgi:hypothetical protein
MSHAAPLPRGTTGGTRTRTPDVFSPRAHAIGRWALPLAIGLVYGYWVAALRRSGGPITTGNLVYGFVPTIVFTLLLVGFLHVAPRLPRELHAFMWFLFTGTAFGFWFIQSGASILLIVVLSLVVGVASGLICFYWYYTHEDAEGHRLDRPPADERQIPPARARTPLT